MRGAGGIAGGGQILGVALRKGPDGLRIAFSEALPDDGGEEEEGDARDSIRPLRAAMAVRLSTGRTFRSCTSAR